MKKLKIGRCYAQAWRSFSIWWIPICLLSFGIFALNLAPRFLVSSQVFHWLEAAADLVGGIAGLDPDRMESSALVFQGASEELVTALLKYTAIFFPVVALLTVALLLVTNWAAKNERDGGQSVLRLLYVTLVHLGLFLLIVVGYFLLVAPGVYLYVKLFFVPLLMLEQKVKAGEAVRLSFEMSRDNFWRLFTLIMINFAVQGALLITVVGIVPATGFVNTVRACAYQELKASLIEGV